MLLLLRGPPIAIPASLQRLTIPVIGLLILAGVIFVRAGPPRAAAPTAGRAVIAFGDSLVAGRGATRGRDFVSVLSDRLGVTIVNAGRSGDTTEAALGRLNRDVLARDPRVVIVLLGGNDFLRGVPRERTFQNLSAVVSRIRSRGAAVVLVAVGMGVVRDPYADRFDALAREHSAALVPDILGGILGNGSLMSDAIHPNDRGYAIMAERIEPVVRGLVDTVR